MHLNCHSFFWVLLLGTVLLFQSGLAAPIASSAATTGPTKFSGTNSTVTDKNNSSTTTVPTPTVTSKSAGQVAADVVVAVITVVVLATIIVMAVYFVKKFEQLNKMVPSYRYSSLKTEINGVNGYDDRIESQSASTEEEDDMEEEEVSLPPTLIVQSQTTLKNSKGTVQNNSRAPHASEVKETVSIDSDDELLQ